jgi:hypothetical protein
MSMARQAGPPSTEAPAMARPEVREVLEWEVLPARSASVATALHHVMLATRVEPGCRGCSVCTQADHVVSIHYEAAWDCEKSLRRDVQSHRFASLVSLVESVALGPPRVAFGLSEGTRGLAYAEEVRAADGRARSARPMARGDAGSSCGARESA